AENYFKSNQNKKWKQKKLNKKIITTYLEIYKEKENCVCIVHSEILEVSHHRSTNWTENEFKYHQGSWYNQCIVKKLKQMI
ncbi:Hypothetical protein EIN_247870, partial [Entamoeba invadens IP1]